MPKISINIPCYNRSELLKECIESFISQSFTDWELILADDGSEDDLTFVKDLDKRIKYVRQDHIGISAAFNLAIDNSTGDYILPFGSDDVASDKDLLKKLFEIAEENKDYDVFYPDYSIYGRKKIVRAGEAHQIYNDAECYSRLLNKQFIPHGGSLWRKEKIVRYDETLSSAVDWEVFLDAFERGLKFFHIKEALWSYRIGRNREGTSQRQIDCCNELLKRRGYFFDGKRRMGVKICS